MPEQLPIRFLSSTNATEVTGGLSISYTIIELQRALRPISPSDVFVAKQKLMIFARTFIEQILSITQGVIFLQKQQPQGCSISRSETAFFVWL